MRGAAGRSNLLCPWRQNLLRTTLRRSAEATMQCVRWGKSIPPDWFAFYRHREFRTSFGFGVNGKRTKRGRETLNYIRVNSPECMHRIEMTWRRENHLVSLIRGDEFIHLKIVNFDQNVDRVSMCAVRRVAFHGIDGISAARHCALAFTFGISISANWPARIISCATSSISEMAFTAAENVCVKCMGWAAMLTSKSSQPNRAWRDLITEKHSREKCRLRKGKSWREQKKEFFERATKSTRHSVDLLRPHLENHRIRQTKIHVNNFPHSRWWKCEMATLHALSVRHVDDVRASRCALKQFILLAMRLRTPHTRLQHSTHHFSFQTTT